MTTTRLNSQGDEEVEMQNSDQNPNGDNAALLLQTLARAASDPNADIDKVERLFAMHERLVEAQAKTDFFAALSSAQQEMRPVLKNAKNDMTRSRYATYAQLDEAVRPIYTRHGIGVTFSTASPNPDVVRIIATASKGGYSRDYQIDMPADGKGARGNTVMTRTHALGSATTYGQRYLLKLIFNLAETSDANDDDGNAASRVECEPISAEQEKAIYGLIADSDTQIGTFLKYFQIHSIEEMRTDQFGKAVAMLERKIELKQQTRDDA